LIAEGNLKIKNLGFKITSFEIKKMTIELANGITFDLQPEPSHNKLYMADDEVEIFLSFQFCGNNDYSIFDYDQVKKGWGLLTDVNLINTYIPSSLYCNKWREITVIGVSSNIHNEH